MMTAAEPTAPWTLLSPDAPAWWLDEVLSSEEAAKELGINPTSFWRRCKRDWCRHIRNGRRFATSRRWLREALARGKTPIATTPTTTKDEWLEADAEARRALGCKK